MNDFVLHAYAERAEVLLGRVRAAFDALELPVDALPDDMRPDDGAIKLVFVGQYSAGKSSIIKMLSGIDTAIGAGITTGAAKAFDWNGMEIIDTPGIHTGLREDHDDITYAEIGQAALLVFVVTGEGFNAQIGAHFRKLAVEQKRGGSMVLVVNKMDRAPEGNSAAQQTIIRDDMRKVIAPYSPEDLYMSFLATKYYEMSCDEEESELRQELLEESGHDAFIENLNAFVAAKGVAARLLKPLRALENAMMKAGDLPEEDQAAYEGNQEIARRKLRAIDNAAQDCESEVQRLALHCQSEIASLGRSVLRKIESAKSEEEAKAALEEAQAQAQILAGRADAEVNTALLQMAETLDKEMEKLNDSPLVRQVIEIGSRAVVPREGEGGGRSVSVGDVMQQAGKRLAGHSLKEGSALAGGNLMPWNVATGKLTEFSGSAMHGIVKTLGKTFGVKFAPWGAVGIARGAAVLGSVLGFAGALYNIWSVFKDGETREQKEKESRKAREEIRNVFSEGAQEVYSDLVARAREKIRESVEHDKEGVREAQRLLEAQRTLMEQRKEQLAGLLTETRTLIEEIAASRA